MLENHSQSSIRRALLPNGVTAPGEPLIGGDPEPPFQAPLGAKRREQIAELVRVNGSVRVEELSRLFGVSRVTIRNDLATLASKGVLLRDRGGAIAHSQPTLGVAFEQRAKVNQEAKRRIGAAAAQLITTGNTVILDAGTTVMQLARSLPQILPLTVITNAWNIAAQIGAMPDVHVILTGGSLSRQTISTVGSWTERELDDLVVDKVFLGAHALDPERGIADQSVEIAKVKAAMIQAARQVILLADASKWGRNAYAKVAPWSSIHVIVTDGDIPPEAKDAIAEAAVEVIRV